MDRERHAGLVVTLDALLYGRRLTEPTFSPDGQAIAYCSADGFADTGERTRSQIAIVSLTGSALGETGGKHDRLARWSPEGTRLAFLSDQSSPGAMRPHLLSLDSGVVTLLGELDAVIEDIRWSSDGQQLLVLAEVANGAKASSDRQPPTEPDPRVLRPARSWRRLYRLAVATGLAQPVGPEGLSVWEFDWDGETTVAAVMSVDPTESGWYTAILGLIDLRSGQVDVLYRPRWQIGSPRLSAGNHQVAFLEGLCSDRGSLIGTVSVVETSAVGSDSAEPGEEQAPSHLGPDLDVASLGWINGQRLLYTGRRGLRSTCGTLSLGNVHDELWSGEAVVREVSASPDGQWLVAVRETTDEPTEVALLALAAPARGWDALTTVNSSLGGLALPLVERMQWLAPDGLHIEGLLVRPRRRQDDEPLPLIVLVHGGPTGAWSHAFPCGHRHAALLAEAGYAVLLPNPRGSSGRGQKFARAVIGDLGGAEFTDLLSGVEACVQAGHADGDRVGIMGASHGGFISAWAVTQSNRFRAGVAIACVSDYLSLHFTSDIGGLDDILFVGPDRVAAYVERSPIAHVDKCRTPLLLIHGEQDSCCPPSQAQEMYGGLVEAGVPTELVMYPREGHGYVELEHQRDLWRRVHGWFDSHLTVRA